MLVIQVLARIPRALLTAELDRESCGTVSRTRSRNSVSRLCSDCDLADVFVDGAVPVKHCSRWGKTMACTLDMFVARLYNHVATWQVKVSRVQLARRSLVRESLVLLSPSRKPECFQSMPDYILSGIEGLVRVCFPSTFNMTGIRLNELPKKSDTYCVEKPAETRFPHQSDGGQHDVADFIHGVMRCVEFRGQVPVLLGGQFRDIKYDSVGTMTACGKLTAEHVRLFALGKLASDVCSRNIGNEPRDWPALAALFMVCVN